MTTTGWDPDFERTLRAFLPGLDEGAPLDPDASLPGYGLDSLGMVALIDALERRYAVEVPGERMAPSAFRTAASTWSLVRELTAAARPSAH